jgi:hypothetical protein
MNLPSASIVEAHFRLQRMPCITTVHSEALLSPPSPPSGKNRDSNRSDGNGNQNARQDLLSGESSFNVENMT